MKKIVTVIFMFITFIIIYFLQVNFFVNFTIAGIKPNLFVLYVLFIGLFANQIIGISLGVIIGFLMDLIYGKIIGVTAIMLCIIGYLGSYFDKNFSKENKITIILMSAGATIIFEFGSYFLESLILNFKREYIAFFRILIVEVIYNIILTILLYPLIQKMGYIIDRIFKKNNILTRYF